MAAVTTDAHDNLTASANINVAAREIDFVTRFGRTWQALREIVGICRPIRKAPGTVLKTKTAAITLESGAVGEGEFIPRSQASVTETPFGEITLEKYAKEVSIEAVLDHGAQAAIEMTDEAFLNELQGGVLDRFYTFLQTGTLTATETTFQMAVAMAIGNVKNKFKTMRKTVNGIALFVNVLDAYRYLGAADITVQTSFGMDYIENFMGAKIVFLSSEIPEGKVIATPVDNIMLYYVDPSDSDIARLGLNYRVQGETNLIGFHASGDYDRATGTSYALLGMELLVEYLDGIAVIDIVPEEDAGGAVIPDGT